jgi:hypothetical protein
LSAVTAVTAVTDKALLREREGGPNLGGEMGGLALVVLGGIVGQLRGWIMRMVVVAE